MGLDKDTIRNYNCKNQEYNTPMYRVTHVEGLQSKRNPG